MDWQQVITLTIVVATAGIFAWRRFRPRKFDFHRDTHCGCSGGSQTTEKSSIVFHARKGERPEITVKMK